MIDPYSHEDADSPEDCCETAYEIGLKEGRALAVKLEAALNRLFAAKLAHDNARVAAVQPSADEAAWNSKVNAVARTESELSAAVFAVLEARGESAIKGAA